MLWAEAVTLFEHLRHFIYSFIINVKLYQLPSNLSIFCKYTNDQNIRTQACAENLMNYLNPHQRII